MAMFRAALVFAILVAGLGFGGRMAPVPAHGAQDPPVAFETPSFIQEGKRYAFTWSGGGPAQTYTVKAIRRGWVLVDVAEETVNPAYLVPGEFPTRWLNAALAISIQEMRPVIH